MDIEGALVSKIVTTGRLEDVVARGITFEHFADDACREMFIWLTEHARKYKNLPSIEAVRDHIAETKELRGFEIEHIDDAIEFLIDKFVNIVKRRHANEAVLEIAKILDDGDPKLTQDIDLTFLEVSRNLATIVPSTAVSRFSDMDKRIEDYERRKAEGKPTGVPFGFPRLDRITGGIHPHQFVVVAGFSGLGKSTLLGSVAFNIYVAGYTPLYISLEEEAEEIFARFDAMAASLDHKKMRQLNLPDEQMENWRDVAERVRETTHDIPVIDDVRDCTPNHVFAETVKHKPDIVIIDYLSLMKSSYGSSRNVSIWQIVSEITRDLKQNARTLKIPIFAAAQTNRSGAKDGAELDNIGNSISIVQDSDIVLGLHADSDMKDRKEMEIRVRKNRRGPLDQFLCIWDHENMVFREKTMRDWMGRPGARNGDSGD